MEAQKKKEIQLNMPSEAWIALGIYGLLLVLTVLAAFFYGEQCRKQEKVEYWTQDFVSEYEYLPLKEGEVVQTFRTESGSLEQFILFFKHFTPEDEGEVRIAIKDGSGKEYYNWNAPVKALSGETFCLVSTPEKPLPGGKTLELHVWLEGEGSNVTIRCITAEGAHRSMGEMTVAGNPYTESRLYLGQRYLVVHSYGSIWVVALLVTALLLAWILRGRNRIPGLWDVLGSLLLVAGSYYCIESMCGHFEKVGTLYACLNCLMIAGGYLLLRGIVGSAAYYVWILLSLVLSVGNYYVLQFRGTPLLFSDVQSFSTAMSVAGTYEFAFPPEVFTGILVLALLSLLQIAADLMREKGGKSTFPARLVLLPVGILFLFVVYGFTGRTRLYDFNVNKTFVNYGWYYSNLCILKGSSLQKPRAYSQDRLRKIVDAIPEETDREGITPKNIIVIMNESFSDLHRFSNLETDTDSMPFVRGLSGNVVKGNLHVSTFGGNTCITEYEFLTGNSEELLPRGAIPYSSLCEDREEGLVRTLLAQGYRTVAMHPYGAANWNRDKVYPALGFQEFVDESAYGEAEHLRKYVSDRGDYAKIIEYCQQAGPDEKLFIFNVTMQNHGGYDVNNGVIDKTVSIQNFDSPMGETFLSLIRESDRAFEELLDYFEGVEEPTMILMFGDHLPSLTNGFYEELYGKSAEELSPAEEELKYITPFVLWTNYDWDPPRVEEISVNYLGSLLLESAGLETSGYDRFLLEQRRTIPVVGKNGIVDGEGNFRPYSDLDESVLSDYRILQYMRINDREQENYGIFRTKGDQ